MSLAGNHGNNVGPGTARSGDFGADDDAGAALVDLHEGTGNRRMGGRVDFDPEAARLGAVTVESADAVGVGAGEVLPGRAVSASAELAEAGPSGACGSGRQSCRCSAGP